MTVLISAGLLSVAVLVPAPPVVLAFIVALGVACPMAGAWQLPASITALRSTGKHGAITELRRYLDKLPEVEHPLGH